MSVQDQLKNDAINEFRDWIGDQKLQLAAMYEPSGSLDDIDLCLNGLLEMQNVTLPQGT